MILDNLPEIIKSDESMLTAIIKDRYSDVWDELTLPEQAELYQLEKENFDKECLIYEEFERLLGSVEIEFDSKIKK